VRRRALLSGSAATLAMLPETVRAQWVDCGGLVPAVVAGPCVPVADLDLTFMAPGLLDPRITFTRASTATYFDSTGVMQTAAIDAPRWDYDPTTLQLRGLLLEDQRQNRINNSATMTGWTLSNTTAVAAQPGAPDGTASMTRIVETATASAHYVATTNTTAASTVHTASVYAKAQQVRYLQLGVDDAASTGGYATFDLQTGTVTGALTARGAAVLGTAQIQDAGNGVYRCAISSSISTATTMRLTLILSNAATPGFAPSYAGNTANGMLVWGMQLEAGDFVTSYIPTTGTVATRGIDSCLITPANVAAGWFTPPGGSWFADFRYFDSTPTNSPRVIGRSDLGAGGGAPLFLGPTNQIGEFDPGAPAVTSATVVSANTVVKAVSSWAAGQMKVCVGGGVVATSPTTVAGFGFFTTSGVSLMTNPTTPPANNYTSGHLRAVRYWSRVLSDADMQAITS
jgi:hypothetical protein